MNEPKVGATVVVCGGRHFTDQSAVKSALDQLHELHPIGDLIHGAASGVDTLAQSWATSEHIIEIDTWPIPAWWRWYGKQAGPMRNITMAQFAVRIGKDPILLAFPGGAGTENMIKTARSFGWRIYHAREAWIWTEEPERLFATSQEAYEYHDTTPVNQINGDDGGIQEIWHLVPDEESAMKVPA
jgi:hypothetical protein